MNTYFKLFLCALLTLGFAASAQCQQQDLNMDPPKIIYVDYAAVLVTIDGPPVLRPIIGTTLARVVNSPFFIVHDSTTNRDYLYGGGYWYWAPGVTSTNWKPISDPPTEVLKQQKLARKEAGADQADSGAEYDLPPSIIVSTEPAELISSTGEASYTKISGTNLSYMDNTDRDVFYEQDSGYTFVLLSGRWYYSKSLDGPWSYVDANRLPDDFSKIPSDSPRARVLTSVAGTSEADQALADAEIPQDSVIYRNAPGPEVTYDGDPVFVRIDGTRAYWADNTPYQVIRVDGRYYCCDEGVWYVANSPSGTWRVATSIPDEILRIPPSSPVYNVKYVYITKYTSDRVYCGYYPGYMGYYVHGPTVVWGTGHRYRGHYRRIACPRPITWGYGAVFVIRTGCWSFGLGFSPDWFNCGYGWGSGFQSWFGPLGYNDYDPDYRYRRSHRIHTRFRERDYNIYGWGKNSGRNAEKPRPRNRYQPPARDRDDWNNDGYRRTPGGWERGGTPGNGRPSDKIGNGRPGDRPGGNGGGRNERLPGIPGQDIPKVKPGDGDNQRPPATKPGEGKGRNERLPGIPGQDIPKVNPGDNDYNQKPPAVNPGDGKGRNERTPGVTPGQGRPGGDSWKPPKVRPGDQEAGGDRWIPETRPIEPGQRGGQGNGQGGNINKRLPDTPTTEPRRGGGTTWSPTTQGGPFGANGGNNGNGGNGGNVNRRLPDTPPTEPRRGGGSTWSPTTQGGPFGANSGRGTVTPAPRNDRNQPPAVITPKKQDPPAKQQDKPRGNDRNQDKQKTEQKVN